MFWTFIWKVLGKVDMGEEEEGYLQFTMTILEVVSRASSCCVEVMVTIFVIMLVAWESAGVCLCTTTCTERDQVTFLCFGNSMGRASARFGES